MSSVAGGSFDCVRLPPHFAQDDNSKRMRGLAEEVTAEVSASVDLGAENTQE
jgi:hypothetical protein